MARVLLVDHKQSILEHVHAVLTRDGVDVCGEAKDARQAIDLARRLKPDVIVMDYSLPDLTGVHASYEIRQFLPNVKIVFFTLHDESVIAAAARVMGADAFVSKSSFGELVLAVRRLIEDKGPVGLGAATVDTATELHNRPGTPRVPARPPAHRK